MYKSKFTLSDDVEEFEGYTDGSLWNGWANVCFTRNQVKEFLDTTPYDYRFIEGDMVKNTDAQLIIYWEDGEEQFPSSPLPTDNGDILEGFFLEGLEFMEVVKKYTKVCPNCFKEIEYVFAYSVRLQEGYFNEQGEVVKIENPIDRVPTSFVCPECEQEIDVKCLVTKV